LKNPLGEENSVMRTVLTPAMLETLGRNFSRNIDKAKAFEIGNTFCKNIVDPEDLPDEQDSLSIGLYGKGYDFFTLKGMVVTLLETLGLSDIRFEAESDYHVYHPGRCARIIASGKPVDGNMAEELLRQADKKIEGTEEEVELMKSMVAMMVDNLEGGPVELGIMGEIHPDVAEEYGIGTKCYCCELMFSVVCDIAHPEVVYTPLPKYPSTGRDIALLVQEDLPVGEIEQCIINAGGALLEDVKLFDIYRGEQVEEGKKSVAFALTYRDTEKTLTDEEVLPVHNKVLEVLKETFNAVLREI
ncbi:MAG: hypothetical protein RR472_07495, partial [Anaerovoracaceae bacterium]